MAFILLLASLISPRLHRSASFNRLHSDAKYGRRLHPLLTLHYI